MKKLFTIIISGLSILSCSQDKKTETTQKTENKKMHVDQYIPAESKDITPNNYVEKVYESIKHYNVEPIYYLRINKQNCLIEVDVNDVNNYKDYDITNIITPIQIGQILNSGVQRVTVKMYPVGNLNNESWGVKDAPPITKLTEESQVAISVISIDEKSNKKLEDEKLIVRKISPKEVSGKEYYEFSFEFDALVPYKFEGWTKGQNLRILDQELVRKKAVEFYEMTGTVILNKDLETWLKIQYPLEKRLKGYSFSDKEDLNRLLIEFKKKIVTRNYKMLPIKNFKMEFMGDGKLLRLRQNSVDEDFRGAGALCLDYGDGYYFPGITLYLPEGRDLATQGFMMWK